MQKRGQNRSFSLYNFSSKNHRGLSTVIVTLILILVSIVAVGIIWVVVRNIIQTGTEGVGLSQFSLSAKIMDVSINDSSNNVSLIVKRNAGKGDLTGISFVFSNNAGTEIVTRNVSLKELEERRFYFNLSMNVSNLISISIIPLIKQDGKEIPGITLDKYTLGKNQNTQSGQTTCTPAICGTPGYMCGLRNNGSCGGNLNCGTCGSQATCPSGTCVCNSGWSDCNNDNACECDLSSNSCSGGSCVAASSWQFDWNVRTDRYGKPAGYFDITPFPINETTTNYSIKNDEFPNGKTYYLGTKYYVDRNIGINSGNCQNPSNPCSTINYAITQAGNGNVAILIKAGTYDLTTSLTVGSGINDTNRWILSGWGQDRPIISGKLLGDNIIKSSSKSYLTVQRLKIQDSSYEGIGFSDGTYISLIDLWVYNTTNLVPIAGDGNIHLHQINNAYLMHLTSEHTYDHCIKIGDNDNNATIEWSIAKECGYWPGIPSVTGGTACGFDFPSDSPQEPANLVLKYSIAHDVLFSCSQVRRQNNYSLHHNEFYNCPNLDAVTGERSHITPQGMVNIHQTSYGSFYDNLVHSGPDGEGIADSSCTDCLSVGLGLSQSSVQTSYIYNNLFWDIARPLFVYGYSGDGLIQHYEILSNSFYGNSNNTLVSISPGTVTLGEDSVSFQNNIIYQNGSNANSKAADLDSDVIRSYNLYYAPYSLIGIILGIGEINLNPLFEIIPGGIYSYGEGHLMPNSPARNNGTSLSSLFATDLDGISRPQGSAWDMGAYEYNGISGGNYVYASTCSYSDVSNAITSASIGNIVVVPVGSCSWTSALTITKGIYLMGAGIGQTIITNGISSGGYLLKYDPSDYSANNAFRLSGFEFNANDKRILDLGSGKSAPFVLQTKVRIDHNKFTNSGTTGAKGQAIWNYGSLYGVVDNNLFERMGYPIAHSYGVGGEGWWANSPQNIFQHGSAYYMYFENNIFNLIAYAGADNVLTDGEYASRYVFRYNTITNTVPSYSLLEMHGQQGEGGSNLPASFGAEIYGNQVTHGSNAMTFWKQRSGQSLIFLNNAVGTTAPDNTAYTSTLCTCPVNYVSLKVTHNSYWWGSRRNFNGAFFGASATGGLNCNGLTNIPTLGRDIFSDASSPGVSSGTFTNLPATCTTGQGYWATSQSTTDLTGMVGKNPTNPISGTLYRCTSPNTWTLYYTPYAYPHPLTLI